MFEYSSDYTSLGEFKPTVSYIRIIEILCNDNKYIAYTFTYVKVKLHNQVFDFNLVDIMLCNTVHCVLSITHIYDKVSKTEDREW